MNIIKIALASGLLAASIAVSPIAANASENGWNNGGQASCSFNESLQMTGQDCYLNDNVGRGRSGQ
ncbi:hypothetical protein [Aestuariivirga litoralis]|uniref:hypothetical protein n=1 Tax=Aestuariivirga litoralis TaxID=2650924 RepID=UPI0018C819CC|nr:hypothetical protein [Aestuariivirga litoralis]MBG1232445.1 hypothetical protein [Aestuariivirga litoralis]